MLTLKFDNNEDWLQARRGKITGSRLKDIIVKRGNGKKIGYYELIAERLGIPADDESAMDRGSRLEAEALDRFAKESGKELDTSKVLWVREDNDSIAISPDASVVPAKKKGSVTEAVEAKCLSSARHIEAYLTQQIPADYEFQKMQYFIVNDRLETLNFVFFDPRLLAIDFFYITVTRDSLEKEIEEYLAYERDTIAEIEEIVKKLTF